MKGAWRALWERRPRLGHKGRAARNLLLVLALAVLVWGQYGCPMPTAEMAFRQMEGQYLLPRSEIVYQSGFWNTGDIERVESRDGTYLSVFDPFVVGVAQNRVYSVTLDRPGRQVLGVFSPGGGAGSDPDQRCDCLGPGARKDADERLQPPVSPDPRGDGPGGAGCGHRASGG